MVFRRQIDCSINNHCGLFQAALFIFGLLICDTAYAKEPTTIVYEAILSDKASFLVMAEGTLSDRKELEDEIELKLKKYPSLKSYMFAPPAVDKYSSEEFKIIADTIESHKINYFLSVQRTVTQGDTSCLTNNFAGTVCSTGNNYFIRVILRDINHDKITAMSELKSVDLGFGDQTAIDFGADTTKKMLDRIIQSLIKNKAF